MSIVDFHLHLFSRTFFETLAAQSPLPGSPADKLARVAEKTGIEIPGEDLGEHVDRWLGEADRHGVERLCAFASVPEEIPVLARAREHAGERLVPFALVNPALDGVAEKVRGLVGEQGFGGVLLFPAMHHYRLTDPNVARVLAVLDGARAVAYVHCGVLIVKLRDLLGLPRPQDLAYANPLGIVPAAGAHPNVRFVVPHFGAGFFRETLMAGAQCPNVYVDSSSSNGWRSTQSPVPELSEVFRRSLDVFGAERILFGTDSNVFPAGWRADRLEEQQAALAAAGASESERGLVLGGNAQRLLAEIAR